MIESFLPTSVNGVTVEPAGSQDSLDQSDFLTLMTAQLRVQDPLAPVDNQDMVAQMAQFSSLAGISEMNTSLSAIADLLNEQTALLQDIRSASTASADTTSN